MSTVRVRMPSWQTETNFAMTFATETTADSTTSSGDSLLYSPPVPWADDLVSDSTLQLVNQIAYCDVALIVAIFGFLANLINVAVLLKQGMGDSVNVSLLALTSSDLAYVTLTLVRNSYCVWASNDQAKANNWQSMMLPQVVMSLFLCARISSALTALISVERCVCVLLPLHTRSLVTRRCIGVAVIIIYVIVTATFVPALMMYKVSWMPTANNTEVAIPTPTDFYLRDLQRLSTFADTVNSVLYPISCLCIVAFCTLMTSIRLRLASKWRLSHSAAYVTESEVTSVTGGGSIFTSVASDMDVADELKEQEFERNNQRRSLAASQAVTSVSLIMMSAKPTRKPEPEQEEAELKSGPKELHPVSTQPAPPQTLQIGETDTGSPGRHRQTPPTLQKVRTVTTGSRSTAVSLRLTRLLITIATIHIACLVPNVVATIVRLFLPEFNYLKKFHNTFSVLYACQFTLDTINASVNFIVYMAMSTRFRRTFISLTSCFRH